MAKYDHIDFTPPEGVRAEAKRGLEWRDEHNRGGTAVGVARARDLSNGAKISPETVGRMSSYFARHEVDKKGEGWSPSQKGFPSAGRIAWALWGGDPGKAWAAKLSKQMESADKTERQSMNHKQILRMVSIREATANPQKKSVEVVIATENPVERWDDNSQQAIPEILKMSGVKFRGDKKQLPIVDSHDRSSVANVLGSVRNLRIDRGQLVGDAIFAGDQRSQDAYQKLIDGHLTDFSITATPRQVHRVKRGEVYREADNEVEGPADIVTEWIPTDASLVAAGADETSTVRELKRSYTSPKGIRRMNEEMKAQLVAMGMPEDIATPEEALTWAMSNMGTERADDSEMETEEEGTEIEIEKAYSEDMPEEEKSKRGEMQDKKKEEEKVTRALRADIRRRKEIQALCEGAKISRKFADDLCDRGVSLKQARETILRKIMQKPLGSSAGRERISVTSSGDDRFAAAMREGLISRTCPQNKNSREGNEFANLNLIRMAERWLQRHQVNTDRMHHRDIAMAALGAPSHVNRYNIERSAYHSTGSFSNLLLDAANKTLLAAYEEAPFTFEKWVRKAPAVQDFKAINRIRFSESPNLEIVPELRPYKEQIYSDNRTSYNVEKYGAIFSVSWETVVNDDLDAISRVPAMHGNAAKRRQNQVVYNVFFSNPTQNDGVALFGSHASGTNLAGASANPTVATLNTAYQAMMVQKGINSDVIVNVTPRFLIVPAALSGTASQLLASTADPLAGGSSTTGNSNTANIYGPNGNRNLELIVEPLLDANSTTAWYLVADNRSIDTLEISFLQGEESPVLENEWDFQTDAYRYKIRQTFGVAPIDWRGVYKYATS